MQHQHDNFITGSSINLYIILSTVCLSELHKIALAAGATSLQNSLSLGEFVTYDISHNPLPLILATHIQKICCSK